MKYLVLQRLFIITVSLLMLVLYGKTFLLIMMYFLFDSSELFLCVLGVNHLMNNAVWLNRIVDFK
jgi:arginine exporter protein ArgO